MPISPDSQAISYCPKAAFQPAGQRNSLAVQELLADKVVFFKWIKGRTENAGKGEALLRNNYAWLPLRPRNLR